MYDWHCQNDVIGIEGEVSGLILNSREPGYKISANSSVFAAFNTHVMTAAVKFEVSAT